jgi:hypothetical protein
MRWWLSVVVSSAWAVAGLDFPSSDATSAYWLDSSQYEDFQSTPALPNESQVCIIGAGMTGVSAAYHLATTGYKVLLLEARGVSSGVRAHVYTFTFTYMHVHVYIYIYIYTYIL